MSSRRARFLRIRRCPSTPVSNLEKGSLRKLIRVPFPSVAEPRNLLPGVSFRFYFILFVLFGDWVGLVGWGEMCMGKNDFMRWGRGTDGPNLVIYKTFGAGR
jgi:hypothetical protein